MSALSLEAGGVVRTAEREMRRWLVGQEVRQGFAREEASRRLTDDVQPYIAISRETGAHGSEIARQLGEQLGWEVLDKGLLDYMAQRYHLSHAMLECVDETTHSWLWDVFGKWFDRQLVSQTEYVAHLGPIVLTAARHASMVFVGRGAQFLLPREKGVSARIVAPLEYRLQTTMESRRCSRRAARAYIECTDSGRRDFIRQYFHHDVDDPDLYDVVLNMGNLDVHAAVNVVVERCRQRLHIDPVTRAWPKCVD